MEKFTYDVKQVLKEVFYKLEQVMENGGYTKVTIQIDRNPLKDFVQYCSQISF